MPLKKWEYRAGRHFRGKPRKTMYTNDTNENNDGEREKWRTTSGDENKNWSKEKPSPPIGTFPRLSFPLPVQPTLYGNT